jgi:hypothetical protein
MSKRFKEYERFPIHISQHHVLLIHVFERTDNLEDVLWLSEYEPKWEADAKMFNKSANQLIDQLEGSYCDAFLEELIKVCQEKLKKV